MADSPDHPRRTDPTLRIGGWLPESRHRAGSSPARPTTGRDQPWRAEPAPVGAAPRPAPPRPPDSAPGGRGRTLVLGGVAVGVLATLVFALSPFRPGPDRARDRAAPVRPVEQDVDAPGGPEAPRTDLTFSPAPVSLSTRAALPPRPTAPTHRAGRPAPQGTTPQRTTPPANSTPPAPPVVLPRPDDLPALPPAMEPGLRSAPGGPETFVDFVNGHGSEVVVYWLDYGGQRQRYAILPPGGTHRQQTYFGHAWVVTDTAGTALACFQPVPPAGRALIR
ncbi:hypothetical protein ACFY3U_08975 [Micromonospora sp. NPDC000089]|uniref:VHL beta domain-containing protein n=1 Tax=unclassified Micromonospora TaxID=2617518 RepID=UPI0036AB811B